MCMAIPDKQPSEKNFAILRWIAALVLSSLFLFGTQIAVRNFLAEIHFYRAYELLNSTGYRQAEIPIRHALRLNPQNGYINYYYGTFLKMIGKKNEALEQFDTAMKTTAHPASVLRQLGEVELDLAFYDRASAHYERALLYDPLPRIAPGLNWYRYGLATLRTAQPGKALTAFRKCEDFEDAPPEIGTHIGFIFGRLRSPASGIQEYVYTLEKHPSLINKLPALALTLTKSGLLDFGRDLFSRLDSLGKLDASGLCLLASFSLYTKDYEAAMEVLHKAQKLNPKEANVYLLMGEIHYQRGEKNPMKIMYQKFLDMYPNAPQRKELEKRILE